MFETFSFLPPLDDGEIARQIDYIIANGWTPCLEFAAPEDAYVKDRSQIRFGNAASCVRALSSGLHTSCFASKLQVLSDHSCMQVHSCHALAGMMQPFSLLPGAYGNPAHCL